MLEGNKMGERAPTITTPFSSPSSPTGAPINAECKSYLDYIFFKKRPFDGGNYGYNMLLLRF